jgi:hypothetical protein
MDLYCKYCNTTKDASEFHPDKLRHTGFAFYCKSCTSARNHLKYQRHREKIKAKNNKYYYDNKEIIVKKQNEYCRNKRKIDPLYVLRRRLSNRIWYACKNAGFTKKSKYDKHIGCSPSELKVYIENQFLEGMSWNNTDKWHLDHIIPISQGKTESEILKLTHYTNLRPLWAAENLKKGSKVEVCWQKLKRDELIQEDKDNNYPFGLEASQFTLSNEQFTVEHRKFIEKYEWLGKVGQGVKWCFTARYDNKLAGVVLLSEPNAYQFEKQYEALIQRGACSSWAPKNLNSRLIMFACNWMVRNTTKRIFVAYSDFSAGEYGTIYQACNFDYLGLNYGANELYTLENGKKVNGRYFTKTSSMKKWAKELNIEWDKSWEKSTGFQDYKKIPQELKKYALEKKRTTKKERIPKKGKYVLLVQYGKDNPNKSWMPHPYPKRTA